MLFNNVNKKALFLVAVACLAACSGAQPLGPDSKNPDLWGDTEITTLFNGAAQTGQHLTIEGRNLQSGEAYKYTGSVTVDGNMPADADLYVYQGKVTVTGDVEDGAKISARLPVSTHMQSGMMVISNGKTTTVIPTTYSVEDGLLYEQDTDPAITVQGEVGDDVKLSANAGIHLESTPGQNFKYNTGWGRTLTVGR